MALLKDVAREANTSISTVSAVMSGNAEKRGIAPGTKERVLAVARELGFSPNAYARVLRTGKSNLIAILGVNLDHYINVMGIKHSIAQIRELGLDYAIYEVDSAGKTEKSVVRDIRSRRVDGILVSGIENESLKHVVNALSGLRYPLVALDDWKFPGADVVTVDREFGSYLAIKHLIDQGHTRIAITVSRFPNALPLSARVAGYIRAHQEAGLIPDESLFLPNQIPVASYNEGYNMVSKLLSHPVKPTAVFFANDRMAIGALRAFYESGIKIPKDMAIVGFDGMPETEYAHIPLTTVEQPVAEVAKVAVSIIKERADQGKDDESIARRVVIQPRLIIRTSSGG